MTDTKYRRADLPPTPAQILADPRVVALVEALEWLEDQRQDAIRRIGKIHGAEDEAVKAMCERHGYGAVMDSASRQWAEKQPSCAFFIGGSIGDTSAATALAPFRKAKP